MVPCTALEDGGPDMMLSPQNNGDSSFRGKTRSELSQEMLMDVPDDLGLADGEQGDHYYESDVALADYGEHGGDMGTLESSKKDGSFNSLETPKGSSSIKTTDLQRNSDYKRRDKAANSTSKGMCGAGEEACCIIF